MNLSSHAVKRSVLKADISVWDLPIVSEGEAATIASGTEILLPTAEDIEIMQQQAYKEAYDEAYEKAKVEGFDKGKKEGHEQGYEKGKTEGYSYALAEGAKIIDEKATHFSAILSTLTTPLEKLDDEVERELATLAMLLGRHLIRRELKQDPSHVIAVIRQAINILPVATRNIALYLHPEDAILVRESLSLGEDDEQRWKIIEDPMLSRGGCKVETEYSRIDASIESQINRVITQVLGGERGDDHAEPQP